MGYLVTKKTTVNGKTTVTTYVETDELEAKRRYHSTLAQAYDKAKDGLEHVLCTLENDLGGQILKEYYFKPEEPKVEEEPIVEEVPSEG